MYDNALYTILIAQLKAAWPVLAAGQAVEVLQKYQPRAEGMDFGPTLYVYKLFDKRYGWPKRDTIPDPDNVNEVIRRETQILQTTFQVTAINKQNPEDIAAPTAGDIANQGAAILQSDYIMDRLKLEGLSLLRITEVRAVWFTNGAEQWEQAPSFDFVLQHNQITLSKTLAVRATGIVTQPI